jgi:hypothetical protein
MSSIDPLSQMRRAPATSDIGPLPRYSILAIHIRAALYGYMHPMVQSMVLRNEQLKLNSTGLVPA